MGTISLSVKMENAYSTSSMSSISIDTDYHELLITDEDEHGERHEVASLFEPPDEVILKNNVNDKNDNDKNKNNSNNNNNTDNNIYEIEQDETIDLLDDKDDKTTNYLPSFWIEPGQNRSFALEQRQKQQPQHHRHHNHRMSLHRQSSFHTAFFPGETEAAMLMSQRLINSERRLPQQQLGKQKQISEYSSLLGERPRHVPVVEKRHKLITVGSTVGQSTIQTEEMSSCLSDGSTTVIRDNNKHNNDDDFLKHRKKKHRRSRSLQPELKYLWGSIKTPIKKIIKLDPEIDLHRSSGCLT